MRTTGWCAGLIARGLSWVSPEAARRFGFWYRHQTVRHPSWCAPISWEAMVRLANGPRMLAPFREIQGMSLILDSCWEQEVTARMLGYLKPGDVFFDIGANMGYYTLLASKAVSPEGLVLAFEPSPGNLHRLLGNLALNPSPNVLVFSQPLSDRAEIAKLWSAPEYNTGVCTLRGPEFSGGSAQPYSWVATTKLDAIEALHGLLPRVSLIKIDTEGLELPVLRGAIKALEGNRRLAIACEFSPQWYSSAELVEFLRGFGFKCEFYAEGQWKPFDGGTPPAMQCNAWFWRAG